MIEQLAIHRFRGIRQGKLEDMGKINVLIGPNNSGKTAILEMLYLTGASGRDVTLLSEKLSKEVRKKAEEKRKEKSSDQASTPDPQNSKKDEPDDLDETIRVFAPRATDFTGQAPWSRVWLRHGQHAKWEAGPATLSAQNSLEYSLKFLADNHLLRIFRLIPPQSDDIHDYGGFTPEDAQTVASFVLPSKAILPPELLPPSLHPYLEGDSSKTRFTFSWCPPFTGLVRKDRRVPGENPSRTGILPGGDRAG